MAMSPSTKLNLVKLSEVTECTKIDKELHMKLFFKGCPVPLPQRFRQGTDCRLTRKSMLEKVCIFPKKQVPPLS